MLQTILDPLYWTPDYARRSANEDDVGEDTLFDAEASPISRDPSASMP